MQDSESDRELLGRYAASGGNAPFRILVDRYSGLVFHTAQRSLGGDAETEADEGGLHCEDRVLIRSTRL
jgi:hypothetical protein